MKVLIAPDSFKESLSAAKVADAIANGFTDAMAEVDVVKLPIADGGEGTVEAMVAAGDGEIITVNVTGPLGTPVNAFFGTLNEGKTAVIEMASSSGLDLLRTLERNPLVTTSRGLGELILAALDKEVDKIILGLGGSATNDAGAGMLQALGVRLLNKEGGSVSSGGGSLSHITDIDTTHIDPRLSKVNIVVACDVDNPLTGSKGATYVFGRQKGATDNMLKILEANVAHFGVLLEGVAGKELCNTPGAGAAGGIGAACLAVLKADLKSGIEIVLESLNAEKKVMSCDLVITGEGCIDGQSIHGKAPMGVANLAKANKKPVIALVGSLGEGYEAIYSFGIDAVFSVVPGVVNLQDALVEAEKNIRNTAYSIAKIFKFKALI